MGSKPLEGGMKRTPPKYLEALMQLLNGPVWDGNVISKSYRDQLVKNGLAIHCYGYAIITPTGLKLLLDIGAIEQ